MEMFEPKPTMPTSPVTTGDDDEHCEGCGKVIEECEGVITECNQALLVCQDCYNTEEEWCECAKDKEYGEYDWCEEHEQPMYNKDGEKCSACLEEENDE